jgi:hypothetical protein
MAAGQGYIEFATGDVLTAAAANGYLASQVVMVFASSAARTSAIASPQEGMLSYLKDTNAVEAYDGAAWISIGSTGDITGVTAGTGISGGGTSGTVTVTNSMATAITTAGDLIKGTGSGTFDRLGIGSTGQVLTVSGGAPAWATPAGGGGKVLQVVNVKPTTTFSSTSPTLVDATNYSVSITPTSSSSRIFVVFDLFSQVYGSGSSNQYGAFKILRGSTDVYGEGTYCGLALGSSQNIEFASRFNGNFIDSPATTSSITYKIQVKQISGGTIIVGTPSSLTLFEIGA